MIIDMHSHYIPPGAVSAIKTDPELYEARVETGHEEPTIFFNDPMQQYAGVMNLPTWDKLTSLDAAKEHLQRIGADGAVISLYVSWHRYTQPLDTWNRLCRLLNDETAEWIKNDPNFKGMATLPLQDGEAAAAELRRATKDLGLVGAALLTNLGDNRSLEAEHLEPLWTEAEALDAPIFIHPANVAARDRFNDWALENLIGNPLDTTIAAASLILSGVLDRHPNLKVALSHGGGFLGIDFARLTHGYHNNPAVRKTAKQPPEAYLRRFYYDTILYHPVVLKYLIELVGADRIMLGTDFPFNMEPPDAVRAIEALEVGKEESAKILGNAAQLYGFV